MIKKIPLPITGVMLGLAALGNLIQNDSAGARILCGILSALLGILFLLKVVVYPNSIKEDLNNPILASISGTFSMAIMLLSVYAKPMIGSSAVYIWYVGLGLHICLIFYYTAKFLKNLDLAKVFASYFIVYVGIAVASVSAPAYEQFGVGTMAFWFGLLSFLALLVLVTYRYVKVKMVPEPAKPLFCIYTAPASLCLAGYIQSVQAKSIGMVGFLLILSTVLYLVVLTQLPKLLKLPFYPSYAAFTFPFVITAIGSKMSMAYFAKMERAIPFLQYVVWLETILAVLLVAYTLVRYLQFLFINPVKQTAKP